MNKELFIKKANIKHSLKYDYSKVEYINATTKVIIICPLHGEFKQTTNNHLTGFGCPSCNESKGELRIKEYLNSKNINFKIQFKFKNCKNLETNYLLPFDFYLPKYNICIEFDGMQHFKPIEHFGGEIAFKKLQHRDNIKINFCKNNNIKLLRIPYNKFNDIESILTDTFRIF